MKNYYAVRVGRCPGIYDDFEDAQDQIICFPRAEWKGFNDYQNAKDYISGGTLQCLASSEKRGNELSYTDNNGNRVYQVYTDGACSRNGQGDAVAGIGVYFGDNAPNNVSCRLRGSIHTSQRAELAAINTAYLLILDTTKSGSFYDINTDSAYAINCITKWSHTWRNNGWMNSSGYSVANNDIIQDILYFSEKYHCRNVRLNKVPAHSDCEGNNRADELARSAIYSSTYD